VSGLDRTFSALSDPTRRDILERLAQGPTSVGELARPYRSSLPAVLKHIRVLERARLVTTQKRGRIRECRLDRAPLQDVTEWLELYRRRERRRDRLERDADRNRRADSTDGSSDS
jgi:DNA-binding transcriptional ArsR family regulator